MNYPFHSISITKIPNITDECNLSLIAIQITTKSISQSPLSKFITVYCTAKFTLT